MTLLSKTIGTLADLHQSELYYPIGKLDEKLKLQFLDFQA